MSGQKFKFKLQMFATTIQQYIDLHHIMYRMVVI